MRGTASKLASRGRPRMLAATTSPWYLPTWVSGKTPAMSPTAQIPSATRMCESTGTPWGALDVELGPRLRLARSLHRLARAQQRLGRDARVIGALPADQLALDQRHPQTAPDELARRVLAGRATADHDHVVV